MNISEKIHLMVTNSSVSPGIIQRTYGFSICLAVIFAIMTLITALGNILVITAVLLVKTLRHPSNLLIVSLAASDLLVSIMVMPFGSYYEYKQRWELGETACDIYIIFDVLLCTASILNLCAISIDRYLAVTKPLEYVIKRTPNRMMSMIAIAWVSSALISISPTLGFKDPFIEGECSYSKHMFYQIYATFGAFYLPLIVMLILYGRIVILARKIAQADRTRNVSTFVTTEKRPSNRSSCEITMDEEIPIQKRRRVLSRQWQRTQPSQTTVSAVNMNIIDTPSQQLTLPQQANFGRICDNIVHDDKCKSSFITNYHDSALDKIYSSNSYEYSPSYSLKNENINEQYAKLELGETSHHFSRMPPLQLRSHHNENKLNACEPPNIAVINESGNQELYFSPPVKYDNTRRDRNSVYPSNFRLNNNIRKRAYSVSISAFTASSRRYTIFSKCRSSISSTGKREKAKKASETKAIRTLGVIMGVFCICWLPFFIVALGLPLYNYINHTLADINLHVKSVLLWLGYINSTLNPMIYAIFNREFRLPFWEILSCRCKGINARIRSKRYQNEYGTNNSVPTAAESSLNCKSRHSLLVDRRGNETRRQSLFEDKLY